MAEEKKAKKKTREKRKISKKNTKKKSREKIFNKKKKLPKKHLEIQRLFKKNKEFSEDCKLICNQAIQEITSKVVDKLIKDEETLQQLKSALAISIRFTGKSKKRNRIELNKKEFQKKMKSMFAKRNTDLEIYEMFFELEDYKKKDSRLCLKAKVKIKNTVIHNYLKGRIVIPLETRGKKIRPYLLIRKANEIVTKERPLKII